MRCGGAKAPVPEFTMPDGYNYDYYFPSAQERLWGMSYGISGFLLSKNTSFEVVYTEPVSVI